MSYQVVEQDVKSMTDSIARVRQMSEALINAAESGGNFQVSGEFREKLVTEVAELTAVFDDVVERSRVRSETLLSTQRRVDALLDSIRWADAGIDRLTARLSQLEAAAAADPNSAAKLHTELKVNSTSVNVSDLKTMAGMGKLRHVHVRKIFEVLFRVFESQPVNLFHSSRTFSKTVNSYIRLIDFN